MRCFIPLAAALAIAGCRKTGADFTRVTDTWLTDQGAYTLDHVSGNPIDITRSVRRKFLGETYYFEREANATIFDRHPWRFLFGNPTGLFRPEEVP